MESSESTLVPSRSRSPRSLVRVVVLVLPILAVGGCLAATVVSSNRGIAAERGAVDPDHYRIDDLTCGTENGNPVASVTVVNTDDATRTFRVRLTMQDADVPDRYVVRSEYVTLDPGATASFDDVVLGFPFSGEPPAFIPPECGVQVLNAG